MKFRREDAGFMRHFGRKFFPCHQRLSVHKTATRRRGRRSFYPIRARMAIQLRRENLQAAFVPHHVIGFAIFFSIGNCAAMR